MDFAVVPRVILHMPIEHLRIAQQQFRTVWCVKRNRRLCEDGECRIGEPVDPREICRSADEKIHLQHDVAARWTRIATDTPREFIQFEIDPFGEILSINDDARIGRNDIVWKVQFPVIEQITDEGGKVEG